MFVCTYVRTTQELTLVLQARDMVTIVTEHSRCKCNAFSTVLTSPEAGIQSPYHTLDTGESAYYHFKALSGKGPLQLTFPRAASWPLVPTSPDSIFESWRDYQQKMSRIHGHEGTKVFSLLPKGVISADDCVATTIIQRDMAIHWSLHKI